MSQIKGTTSIQDFADCDLVMESVTEQMELKQEIFADLDRICPKHTILATNTSCLSVIDLAMATRRPEKVIGTHFFSPVPVMKLVELVVSLVTGEETVTAAKEFCHSIGKEPVTVKDSPGFVTTHLFVAYCLEAIRMLEAGISSREDIDKSVEMGLNYPMGPFRLLDMAGIDTLYHSQKALWEMTKNPIFAPVLLLDKMMAAGHLGQKTGKGFYDYTQDK